MRQQPLRKIAHQSQLSITVVGNHDKPHAGPADRFANRRCISRIMLAPLDVRLHELRRNQLRRVPQQGQFARTVMRAAARFHGNDARLQACKERHYLLSYQCLAQYRIAVLIYAMHRKHPLRRVSPLSS